MWPSEVRRALTKQGCTFESHQGGSGHLKVYLRSKSTQLPMHGKEFGTGILNKIYRDLGLVPPKKRSQ